MTPSIQLEPTADAWRGHQETTLKGTPAVTPGHTGPGTSRPGSGPFLPPTEHHSKAPGGTDHGARGGGSHTQQPWTRHTGAEQSAPAKLSPSKPLHLPEPERGPAASRGRCCSQGSMPPEGTGELATGRRQGAKEVLAGSGIWGLLSASQAAEGRGACRHPEPR